ncbi:MAG: DUF11 domain-containing protein, partial [Oscillochloris sp.]|nr:DUF11 domain-containing protein [Oscillochloris sp.]
MSNFARRCLFFIALFVLSSWELTSGSVVRAADSAYDIRLSSNVTIVNSGDWAVIKVDYSCSAVYSVPCQNVVISTLIPPELGRTISDVQVLDSSGMTTTSYDAATSTARWAFKNDIAPGAAGYVELRVRFPQGSTPDETIALLQAMMSGSNSPTATSNQLPLTANADPYMQVAKRFVSGGVVDLPTVYQVESCVPSSSGSLDVTNIVMRDTLPANAVFVSATDGGTYDAATNTIIWPVEDILVSAGETCLTHSVTVRFPSSSFVAGDEVRNNLDVDGTALGGTHISRSAFDTRLIQPPTPGASFGKSGPSTAEVGQEITYTFTERNEGTSPLSNHSVTDVIPTDLQVSRINAAAHNQPTTIRLQIEYQTNLNATWSNATPAPLTGAACIDVTRNTGCAYTLTLSGGEWITALRYTYLDDLPYGFSVTGHGFRAIVLSTPTNQIIVNTADSTYSFNGHQILSQSTARTRIVLYVASARPRITKAATPTIAHSGDVVTYTLTLRNETFRSLTMP